MAALVVVALFWGNCLSCPLALASVPSAPTHPCCHHPKVPTDCPASTLHNYVKADSGPALTPSAPVAVLPVQPALATYSPVMSSLASEPAPPDLFSLNSSFRI